MTLTRRCPRCKSKDIRDERIASKKHHGGLYWAVKCYGCNRVISGNWELVDESTGKTVATIGNCKAVKWRKKSQDNLDSLSGRDAEGMAL
jgi:hypothetical protein